MTVRRAADPLRNVNRRGYYRRAVLANSPLAYWPMDDADGNYQDVSGNARHFTYNTNSVPEYAYQQPSLHSDEEGKSAYVGGDSDGAYLLAASWMDATSLTVELWFRPLWVPTTAVSHILISKRTSANTAATCSWAIRMNTSLINGYASTGSAYVVPAGASTTIIPGVRHHCALVIDTTNDLITFYLDGAQEAQSAYAATVSTAGDYLRIGYDTTSDSDYRGFLQDVAIYGSALTAAQVLAHYQLGTKKVAA